MPESQTTDDEGNHIDPSKGAAMESICANFLADPNFNTEEPVQEPTGELDGAVEDNTGI